MSSKKEFTREFFQKQGSKGGAVGGPVSWQRRPGETIEQWEKRKSDRAREAVAKRKWHAVKPKEEESPPPIEVSPPPAKRRVIPKRKR